MGAKFSVSIVTPSTIAAAAPAAVLRSAAAGQGIRPRIRRCTVMVHASPATSLIDLYRVAAANYGTQSATSAGQSYQSADISGTTLDTAWSAAPTLPASPVRIDGCTIAGVVGNGYVFTFPDEGLILEPNTALLFWCPSPGAAQLRITPVWEE